MLCTQYSFFLFKADRTKEQNPSPNRTVAQWTGESLFLGFKEVGRWEHGGRKVCVYKYTAVLDVAVWERTGSYSDPSGGSRIQVCQFHCYVASLVRFLLKKEKTFLSADSRLRWEYYKVFKIDHYDIVKSFEGCATLLRRRAICWPNVSAKWSPTSALNPL
jgi:hypothetical protein